MQFAFQKQPFRYLETGLQEIKNTEVTQELRLPDGMPDIGRVLTTWGQVILRSKEWQGSQARTTGGVMTWTLYAPEDGTEPRSVESWLPFELKWEMSAVNREGPVVVLPLLRFADSRSLSARKMMVRAGVGALAQGFYPEQTEIGTPGELPEDVELLKNTYPLRMNMEAGEKVFLLDEELSLDGSQPPDKLLGCTVLPEVTETRVLSDKLAMKGNLKIHAVCREPEGRIRSWDSELPFSQLAQLDESHGTEAKADVHMAVTNLEADLPEPGRLRIKSGLTAQYVISDQKMLELVQDAYSPRRQVETEMKNLDLPVILDNRQENLSPAQSVPGQFGMMADGVFLPDFPRQRRNGNNIEMEIPGLFQSLVYEEDGVLQPVNVRWEGHMNLPADENARIVTPVQSSGRAEAVETGEGMRLESQALLGLQSSARQEFPMVEALELGQAESPDVARPSVILTMGGTEPLWDLAKRCGSTVSAIRAANGLDADPVQERMLLIPVL